MKKTSKTKEIKEVTIIPENTKLEGDIEAMGSIVVIGSFSGTMRANALEISKGGSVHGTVEVENAMIGGKFDGEMACNAELLITKKGVVKGRLLYGSLRIEPGGFIDASVSKLETEDTKLLTFRQKQSHP